MNQITVRFQSQKAWYRWAKEYGEVIPNQYCVETWRERNTMYQICPPKEDSMDSRVVVADLTDPYHPVLAGTMKEAIITEYLQYYGSDQLLGIEYEHDEEREYPNSGLKLTMYDISNLMELKEITSVCIWEGGTFDKDAKELLASADKNVIGITTHEGGDTYFHWLSFENGEFVVNMKEEDLRYSTRGVYIDDVLYVVNGKEVKAFSMGDGSLVERLKLVGD